MDCVDVRAVDEDSDIHEDWVLMNNAREAVGLPRWPSRKEKSRG